jgi:ABC-type phosphate transport system substrate-binding protein
MGSGTRAAIGAAVLLVLAAIPGPADAQVAVIVHRSSAVSTISKEELRRLYLGEQDALPGGKRIVLVEEQQVRPTFYARVVGMSPDRVKRHWLGKVFSGDREAPPRGFASSPEVVRFVAQTPDAIAFVDAAMVDTTVKVLPVDGRRTGQPGYLLQ